MHAYCKKYCWFNLKKVSNLVALKFVNTMKENDLIIRKSKLYVF